MKRIVFFLIANCVFAYQAQAQIYRCEVNGVTVFSQLPCADDAEVIQVKTIDVPTPERTIDEVAELCFEHIRNNVSWKDPNSLRLYGYDMTWKNDRSGTRRVMVMRIGATNSYGAYDGVSLQNCFLNHSGTALSTVQHFIN